MSYAGRSFPNYNFAGAGLRGADFTAAFLVGADFTGADLRGAIFCGAHIGWADFTGANTDGALFEGALWGTHQLRHAPIIIRDLRYVVAILSDHVRIGCATKTIKEWLDLTPREAVELDGKEAARFWDTHKDSILHRAMR